MSSRANLTSVLRQLPSTQDERASDTDLLSGYAQKGNQEAFAALVRRYGPLVLGVARRQLADRHRAEDVFQATFLALARSAPKLGRRPVLTNWLYTVALRLARKARARAEHRATAEHRAPSHTAPGTDPLASITGRELVQMVDEELARLPDRLRLPVLLCCVQGLSREEAAQQLGWSHGSVKGRLERGRRRLADRLAARGIVPAAVLFAPLVAVTVPPDLLARTADLAVAPWAQSVPSAVAVLAASRVRVPAAALVAGLVVAVAVAAGALRLPAPAEPPVEPSPVAASGHSDPPGTAPAPDEPLPDGAVKRFGSGLFRHPAPINSLVVSPDGTFALANSDKYATGALRAYDLRTGRPRFTLEVTHEGPGRNTVDGYFQSVAVSSDGKTLATNQSGTLRLHDAATGKETVRINYVVPGPGVDLRTFSFKTTHLLLFEPNSTHVLVAAGDGNALILVDPVKTAELGSVQVLSTFSHDQRVLAAAFSPDGKHLVGGGEEREKGTYFARLWNVATGKELHRLWYGSQQIQCVAYSPDGSTVAVGGDRGDDGVMVRLFDAATGKEKLKVPFPKAISVRSLAFSPNGKTLAAASGSHFPLYGSSLGDGTVRLFEVGTGKEKLVMDGLGLGLRFSPDGASLAGAVANAIYRWDTATGKALTPTGLNSQIEQIEVTADGRRLFAREFAGAAHLWDAHSGEHLRRVGVTWSRGSALSPDGRFLVWPVPDGTVKFKDPARPDVQRTGSRLRLFDLTTGALVERFDGFAGDATTIRFTPNGRKLVTVDHRDGGVRLWDVATGKVERTFSVGEEEKSPRIARSCLSPDGKTLAAAYDRQARAGDSKCLVKLWDIGTGKELNAFQGFEQYVGAMAFSPNGKRLVTADAPLFLQSSNRPTYRTFVWDVESGKQLTSLPVAATAVAFAPDGKTLAVVSAAGAIQFWDVGTWKVRGEFPGPREWVTALTFGPDGRLYTGTADAQLLAWDPRAAKPPAERK